MKNFIVVLIIFFIIPVKVFAWCSEPMAPSAPSSWSKPSKPSVPFCVNEWNNTHTCSDWKSKAIILILETIITKSKVM